MSDKHMRYIGDVARTQSEFLNQNCKSTNIPFQKSIMTSKNEFFSHYVSNLTCAVNSEISMVENS